MIKKNLKLLIITSVTTLLPTLAGIMLWNQLPKVIPTHWNINGEADGWSSKPFVVFAMPLILLALQWVVAFVTLSDPKKQNHSQKIISLSFWLVPVLSIVLSAVTYVSAMGNTALVKIVFPIFMGLMFVIVGNYMPKCKQNYTIGIKIPWTLNNEENWNKTHRFAGWIWMIGGIVITVLGFLSFLWIVFPVLFVMALAPIIYSYALHKKDTKINKEHDNNG